MKLQAPYPRPTKQQLAAAQDKKLADIIRPDLRIVFCGINPSLYSAAVGHHFGRPGNRFWPAIAGAGFTPRVYGPWEDEQLPALGWGLTNLVERATARADQLSAEELAAGGRRLRRTCLKYRPHALAVLGVTAYRAAFASPKVTMGEQAHTLGDTRVWVLPNPSGLNAHYQLPDLVAAYAQVRVAMERGF